MLAMDFTCFLILLVISIAASAILHFGIKFYIVPGVRSFIGKVVIGWVGAWLGSPVLGHWWEGVNYQNIYFIPAILGSFALLHLSIDGCKTMSELFGKSGADVGSGAKQATL